MFLNKFKIKQEEKEVKKENWKIEKLVIKPVSYKNQ